MKTLITISRHLCMCAADIGYSVLASGACFLFEALPSDMRYAMLCMLMGRMNCTAPVHAPGKQCRAFRKYSESSAMTWMFVIHPLVPVLCQFHLSASNAALAPTLHMILGTGDSFRSLST